MQLERILGKKTSGQGRRIRRDGNKTTMTKIPVMLRKTGHT